MRGSPISRSSSGRSPLPQGSRLTVALIPRSLATSTWKSGLAPDWYGTRSAVVVRFGTARAGDGALWPSGLSLLLRRTDPWIGWIANLARRQNSSGASCVAMDPSPAPVRAGAGSYGEQDEWARQRVREELLEVTFGCWLGLGTV